MANSLKSLAKTGFGLGIGLIAAQILFLILGAALFIPGYVMFTRKENEQNTTNKVVGVVLMAVGVIIMGGMGFGILTESLGELFD
jgi:hypothetical protein